MKMLLNKLHVNIVQSGKRREKMELLVCYRSNLLATHIQEGGVLGGMWEGAN